MNKQKGQSLIEIIFAVGILVIVVTAVISLVVKTTGVKSSVNQRKKASEMSEVIVENLMELKKNQVDTFWKLESITTPQTLPVFDGYQYVVSFTPITDGECNDTVIECVEAEVTINWSNNQTLKVNRFFSKKM